MDGLRVGRVGCRLVATVAAAGGVLVGKADAAAVGASAGGIDGVIVVVGAAASAGGGVAVATAGGDAVSVERAVAVHVSVGARAVDGIGGPDVSGAGGMLLGVAASGSCQAIKAPSEAFATAMASSGASGEGSVLAGVTVAVGPGGLHAVCLWYVFGPDCSAGIPSPTANDIRSANRLSTTFCLAGPSSCHIHNLHQRLVPSLLVVTMLTRTAFKPCSLCICRRLLAPQRYPHP